MRRSIPITATVGALVAATTLLFIATAAPAQSALYPRDFVRTVDNPWFPLRTGATFVYRGVENGKPSRDVVHVTGQTKLIAGIRCTAVSDRLYLAGKLEERTTDWYAQDRSGTVWYFGEDTAELDAHGRVTSTEGTWQTGRDGAQAGVFMPATPRIGQAFRQEYLKGHAEDHFQVVSLAASVETPDVSSTKALLTKEWSPLEPGVVDHKLYVRGVGFVAERTIRGGTDHAVLVSRSA
jgi:hypothetical protein